MTKATAHEIAALVTEQRGAGHYVAEPVATALYGSGKTVEQVKAALLHERGRCAEIANVCDARGVPEVKAELLASGIAPDKALARIGEAVEVKAIVNLAADMSDVIRPRRAQLASDFIAKRITPAAAGAAMQNELAAIDEATAIVGYAPRIASGSREAMAASMKRTLKQMGIKPKD